MTPFFSTESLSFLEGLKANNARDWFTENKAVYEAEIKAPAAAFADAMSASFQATTGAVHAHKIFRIHRDVRFSKDKTPYNTHVHISFTPSTDAGLRPSWFFGLNTERLTIGCGIFAFEKAALETFRAEMAGQRGAELIALIASLKDQGLRIGEPELKTVPRGFDRDHPNAEVLRRKGFTAWRDMPDRAVVTAPDLVEKMATAFKPLLPVYRFLGASA